MQSAIPIALIIPGQGPITNFNCDNGLYHVEINNPGQVSSICVSLTNVLPENFAIAVYFSQPPYSQMQYLGALSNNRPSDIFQTGFPLRQQLASLKNVILCFKPQHFNQLTDLVLASDGKKQYSKLVAQNLYNFMMSYNNEGLLQHGIQGDYMVIPSNFLGKWLQKFQQKYAKDPNFILKTTTH